jgi:hypothetical protein
MENTLFIHIREDLLLNHYLFGICGKYVLCVSFHACMRCVALLACSSSEWLAKRNWLNFNQILESHPSTFVYLIHWGNHNRKVKIETITPFWWAFDRTGCDWRWKVDLISFPTIFLEYLSLPCFLFFIPIRCHTQLEFKINKEERN